MTLNTEHDLWDTAARGAGGLVATVPGHVADEKPVLLQAIRWIRSGVTVLSTAHDTLTAQSAGSTAVDLDSYPIAAGIALGPAGPCLLRGSVPSCGRWQRSSTASDRLVVLRQIFVKGCINQSTPARCVHFGDKAVNDGDVVT